MKKALLVLFFLTCFAGSGALVVEKYQVWHQPVVQQQTFDSMYAATCRIRMDECWGSGVVVYSERDQYGDYNTYILTCNHLFREDNSQIKYVEFFDNKGQPKERFEAILINKSANNEGGIDEGGNLFIDLTKGGEDVALLKIKSTRKFPVCKLPTLQQVKELKMLDNIRVIGAALADKPIPTAGEITRVEDKFITINAPCIFGNSGGPCFLSTGELIGLVNMGRAANGQFITHMGFIRPIGRIYDLMDSWGYGFIRKGESGQKAFDNEKSLELQKQIKELKSIVEEMRKNTQILGLKDEIKALNDRIVILENQLKDIQKKLEEMEKKNVEKDNREISPPCPGV